MTTPPSIPPWAIADAESLVEPVVCANSGGENEYTRLPTISEIAAGLVVLREKWAGAHSGAGGATPLTDSLVHSFGKFHLDTSDFSKLTEHARQLERNLAAANARAEKAEAELENLTASGIHSHSDSCQRPSP